MELSERLIYICIGGEPRYIGEPHTIYMYWW